MRQSVGAAMWFALLGCFASETYGEVLPYSTVYTLRDLNRDGSVNEVADTPPVIGVPSFWGFISNLPSFVDETFVEFRIQSLGQATQARLHLSLSNSASNLGAANVKLSSYVGNGKVELSRFGVAGDLLSLLQVTPAPPGEFCCALSLDVTALYNEVKAAGGSYLGFRLHDPSWTGLPSQGQAFLTNTSLEVTPVPEQTVQIKIRLGNDSAPVNPRSNGVVQVALLSDAGFDATDVNLQSLRFGGSGTEAAPVQSVLVDVDRDGDIDLVAHFRTARSGIACEGLAVVTGQTRTGQPFRGRHSLRSVGCNSE